VTGDIGAVTKLQSVNTNDTLCTQENPVVLDKIEFPEPVISMAVQPTAKGDEEKISAGLNKLQDEDPLSKLPQTTKPIKPSFPVWAKFIWM